MVLFVSDMHFGRGAPGADRTAEADLLDLLDAHADCTDHLVLVGDVFDAYVEYRHLVPKGAVRVQAALARWSDRDIPVTYLHGNHDPWHRDYFTTELGVRVVEGPITLRHAGRQVHVEHGDAIGSTHGFFPAVRTLLRHPVPVWMYRSLLPADLGMALARWASRRLHKSAPDPRIAAELAAAARTILAETPADAVVMGHSHVADRHTGPNGTYVNTGAWYESRSFARLDEAGLHLYRWNGTRACSIEAADVDTG